MEEDQEFYKKLMSLMNDKGELKLRNPDRNKTLKITLNVEQQKSPFEASNNILCGQSEKIIIPEIMADHKVEELGENDFEMFSQGLTDQKGQCRLHELSEEKLTLEPISMSSFTNTQISPIPSEKKVRQEKYSKESQGSTNAENKNEKPKKVKLGLKKQKKVKPVNQAVLHFIQERQTPKPTEKQNPTLQSSKNECDQSLSIDREFNSSKKQQTNSKTVNESIEFLKELHPQNKGHFQIISQRLKQLQEVEKVKMKLDESISEILSTSMNNNSLRFDSFDVSMLSSLKLGLANDPLCEIFAKYLKRTDQTSSKNKNHSASFLFLYSQPMLDIKGREINEQINYFEEEAIIQKVLKEIKCRIDYIRQRATKDKFHYWVKQGVQILHFCGHGVEEQSNYLLFENNLGKSVKMGADSLSEILSELKIPLKLVFVASCHSESTGKIFCEAGAKHVVCVKDDYVILDTICHEFVRVFYQSCIHDKMQICEAFEFTKKQLKLSDKFSCHEIDKFVLITNHKKKQCHSLSLKDEGNFKDLTLRPFYSRVLPSRVENFIPRPKDLYQILKLIDSKKRFITITGMAGIGKSTLARQLVRYVQFRNIFLDGVVYVEIRACENMNKIIEILDLQLFQTTTLKHNRSLQENTQKIFKELSDKNVLIVVDNCQNIMASDDKENFKKMIEAIMKNCDNIYFVFTHRHSLSRQIDYCNEKIFELNKLNERQSYNLFFQTIPRTVDRQEMKEFLKIEKDIKENSKHPIFDFLNGHPEAICMTASLLADRSLPELYELLLKPFQDLSSEFGIEEKKLSNDLTSSKVVETAMKISLNVLKNKHKAASEMMKVLSLLPQGLDSEMMSKLFRRDWKENVKKLIHHSLVKVFEKGGSKYYSVHPNIIIYIESEIGVQEKIRYHERICDQYMKRCEKIYKHVGTLSSNSQRAQQLFLNEEDNYKMIILRELSFYGQRGQLKKFYSQLFQEGFMLQNLASTPTEEETFHSCKTLIDLKNYLNDTNKKVKYNEKLKESAKKEPVMVLIVFYVTNLFVIKKSMVCQKYIEYGVFLATKKKYDIVAANLIRIKACIELSKNRIGEARQYFQVAWQLFALEGCGLGSAGCEAAIGYIKFLQEQYAMAKMNMQNALKYYDQIFHPFGKHYLNRWLCSLKAKMNRNETELINHKREAQKLLKEAKESLRSSSINNTSLLKHKLGYFVFRFLFDNISLFLEASFEMDVKPKLINPLAKKTLNEKNTKLQDKFILKEEKINWKEERDIFPMPKEEKQKDKEKCLPEELVQEKPLKSKSKSKQTNYMSTGITKPEEKKEQAVNVNNPSQSSTPMLTGSGPLAHTISSLRRKQK